MEPVSLVRFKLGPPPTFQHLSLWFYLPNNRAVPRDLSQESVRRDSNQYRGGRNLSRQSPRPNSDARFHKYSAQHPFNQPAPFGSQNGVSTPETGPGTTAIEPPPISTPSLLWEQPAQNAHYGLDGCQASDQRDIAEAGPEPIDVTELKWAELAADKGRCIESRDAYQ